MIIITNSNYNLIKYHINTINEDSIIKIFNTNNLGEIKDRLLESVDYDNEGNLCSIIYIIIYTGKQILSKNFKQAKHNKTYIIVENIKLYTDLISQDNVLYLELNPIQYQHIIESIAGIFESNAWPYFWSEYCIKRFKSNPYKWYNEARYLLFEYTNRDKKKLSCEDLDNIYNKVTNKTYTYIRNMYTYKSKKIILSMTDQELFTTFIRGENKISLVENNIKQYKKEFLYIYIIMKEAFYEGVIKLRDAVIIFDYLINKETKKTTQQIRYLFNLR